MINTNNQINNIPGPGPSIKQNTGPEQKTSSQFADSVRDVGKFLPT